MEMGSGNRDVARGIWEMGIHSQSSSRCTMGDKRRQTLRKDAADGEQLLALPELPG